MCGRYTQHHSTDQVVMRFDVTAVVAETSERYNAAPTQQMPVITMTANGRELDSFRWGLIPFWAKDISIGNRMLNARAETLAEKPAFRNALKRRRCLVPADGYYEWKAEGKAKLPIYYRLKGDDLFAFAGLWEEWTQADGKPLRSFTIITTAPNALAAAAHDRMPAILLPEAEAMWIEPGLHNYDDLLPLMQPFPAEDMECYPVSRRVNTPAPDDRDLIAPTDIENGLFGT